MSDNSERDALRKEHLHLDLGNGDVLDVLDLPQLHQKPPAKTLLHTLSLLSLEPPSWEGTPTLTPNGSNTPRSISGATTPALPAAKPRVRPEGVPQYLTRIVSSPLAWIKDDEEKEEIWDAASVRLSERSGRTGMGAITRSFRIPTNESSSLQSPDVGPTAEQMMATIDLDIHEPALTEDNLGLKTWASSYVLAKKWHTLRHHLPLAAGNTILELGAGTGLVGMAAAAVLQARVLLTDLPDIVSNLERNIESNNDAITSRQGSARAAILDWTVPEKIVHTQETQTLLAEEESSDFPLIVSADPIYSKNHPAWLVQTVACHLSKRPEARVILMVPIRDAYADERADLKQRMQDLGLVIEKEEIDVGYDDWSEGRGDDLAEVECWMTIWRWKQGQV